MNFTPSLISGSSGHAGLSPATKQLVARGLEKLSEQELLRVIAELESLDDRNGTLGFPMNNSVTFAASTTQLSLTPPITDDILITAILRPRCPR